MTRKQPLVHKGHEFFIEKEHDVNGTHYYLYQDGEKKQRVCHFEMGEYYDAIENCPIDFEKEISDILRQEILKH
jgi:hypothetical protein